MKQKIFYLLILLILNLCFSFSEKSKGFYELSQTDNASEPVDFIQNTLDSTVIIECTLENGEKSLGSGFFIDQNGTVVTNYHVVADARKINVRLIGDNSSFYATISSLSEKNDLALLKTSVKHTFLRTADTSSVKVGDEVFAVGNPLGLHGTVSKGIVSGVRNHERLSKVFQITAPISKGSSGGPVINSNGEVIAVSVAYIDGGQNLNFAIPISVLSELKPSNLSSSDKQIKLLQLVEDIENNGDNFLLIALSRAVHYESKEITKIKLKNKLYPKIINSDGTPFSGWVNWSEPPNLTAISQYENGLVHGVVVSWQKRGIDAIQIYQNGSKEGLEVAYWEGDIKRPFWKYFVKNGKRDGIKKEWYSDGKLCHIENYKDGKLHGSQKYYFMGSGHPQYEKFYDNGKLLSMIGWEVDGDKSPTLISRGEGKCYKYDARDEGRLHQIDEYFNSEIIKSTSFWDDGVMKLRHTIYEDKDNWHSTYWHPNGKKRKEVVFKDFKIYWAKGWDTFGQKDETKIEEGNGIDVIYDSRTGAKLRMDRYRGGRLER